VKLDEAGYPVKLDEAEVPVTLKEEANQNTGLDPRILW